jgi:tetratricopeptide (TPR) repeat protein
MLNIHELERQWLRYKIKSYIPLVLSIFATVSIIALFFVYLPLSDIETTANAPVEVTKAETIKVQAQTIPEQEPIQKPVVEPIELYIADNTQEQIRIEPKEEKSALVLKPSLHFMDNIEDGLSTFIEEEMPMQESVSSSMQDNGTLAALNDNENPDNTVAAEETDENRLNITSNHDDSDLKDVIRRFKKNKNPALSLFIAKRYYAAGEYQKSYNYALMTNEIDKNIEESWIIFSKSLVKLGQHELAMNTLKSYLKTTKSSAADVLLRKIESGTFK